jgi:molecular chaperone DnaK
MDAGKIAGIEVYELLMNQLPSLAYGLDKKTNETILVLIWVVVHLMFQFRSWRWYFEVLSTAGDTNLGGDDFDKVLVNWLMMILKKKKI